MSTTTVTSTSAETSSGKAPCTASALFAAAVRKEHIDVNDQRYQPGGIAAGAATVVDFTCADGWAYGWVGRPEAGPQDGGTLFRDEGGEWVEVAHYDIQDESACALHTKFGAPVATVNKLSEWATPCVTTSSTSGGAWTTYTRYSNSNYGFSVEYPTALLAYMPSDSYRHMNFTSDDPDVLLSVYAHNNTESATTQSLMAERKSTMSVSYSRTLNDGFVISGADDGFIWYERDVVYSNVVYILRWVYPESMKTQLDAAVTHSYETFTPGPNIAK